MALTSVEVRRHQCSRTGKQASIKTSKIRSGRKEGLIYRWGHMRASPSLKTIARQGHELPASSSKGARERTDRRKASSDLQATTSAPRALSGTRSPWHSLHRHAVAQDRRIRSARRASSTPLNSHTDHTAVETVLFFEKKIATIPKAMDVFIVSDPSHGTAQMSNAVMRT